MSGTENNTLNRHHDAKLAVMLLFIFVEISAGDFYGAPFQPQDRKGTSIVLNKTVFNKQGSTRMLANYKQGG